MLGSEFHKQRAEMAGKGLQELKLLGSEFLNKGVNTARK